MPHIQWGDASFWSWIVQDWKPLPINAQYIWAFCIQLCLLGFARTSMCFASSEMYNYSDQKDTYHVEEERLVGSLDSCINVGIGTNNERALATQLKGDRLDALSCILHDDLAHLCASSKGHLYTRRSKDIPFGFLRTKQEEVVICQRQLETCHQKQFWGQKSLKCWPPFLRKYYVLLLWWLLRGQHTGFCKSRQKRKKADLVNSLVSGQSIAGGGAIACQDVQDTGWHSCFQSKLAHPQGREGSLLCNLDNHSVSCKSGFCIKSVLMLPPCIHGIMTKSKCAVRDLDAIASSVSHLHTLQVQSSMQAWGWGSSMGWSVQQHLQKHSDYSLPPKAAVSENDPKQQTSRWLPMHSFAIALGRL